MIVLVALRVGIGWHFYREGVDKLHDPDFTSAGFFRGAQGTFAPTFKLMLWDADGRVRLDQRKTQDAWKHYRERIAAHYGFSEEQQKQADEIWRRRDRQLRSFFEVNGSEIDEYFLGLARLDRQRQDPARVQVPSLADQNAKWESELTEKRGPWLAQLDHLWKSYERDLNAVATPEQQRKGRLRLEKPSQSFINTDLIDQVIPWFDTIVGGCLILGLFTRLASVAGAVFLASVMATQWPPWAPDTMPVYYQSIEMLALLTLAAIGAGRFAGLDFLLHSLRMRCCPPKNTGTQP